MEYLDISKQQWMVENIPSEDEQPLSQNLLGLKNLFFEQLNGHNFTHMRLYWLSRWLGEIPENFYQNEVSLDESILNLKQVKRVKLLFMMWKNKYFHPFATLEESYEIVEKLNKTSGDSIPYCISLSSTVPGQIRLTYVSRKDNSVYHHRIDVEQHLEKDKVVDIGYDVDVLEKYVLEYLNQRTGQQRFQSAVYVSFDEPRVKLDYSV